MNPFNKILIYSFLLLLSLHIFSQPLLPPYPFEDTYGGRCDSMIKLAGVKVNKTYYRTSQDTNKFLYCIEEFNKNGFRKTLKMFNFKTHKEMYSATYGYSLNNFYSSCEEIITSDIDNFDFYSRKKDDNGYFVGGTETNPMGEIIPRNKKGELIVKTIYSLDLNGICTAKKYFIDNTFYKQKRYSSWGDSLPPYYSLFFDKNKEINFSYSNSKFLQDTFKLGDSICITIKSRNTMRDIFKIIKIKNNFNYVIAELFLISESVKLCFSTWSSLFTNSITYFDISNSQNRLLLEHRFNDEAFNETFNEKIELNEIYDFEKLRAMNGALFFTDFVGSRLYKEVQYSIENEIIKMQEKHFDKNNFPSKITAYKPHFDNIFGPFSLFFREYDQSSIEEIHEYEYYE